MPDKYLWLAFVGLAGLAWGTYVPLIAYGGSELGGRANARLTAILCVGVAYFIIAVIFPLAMFLTGQYEWPSPLKSTGLIFAGLAGVAGAVGAICVIFATQSAVNAAREAGAPPPFDRYKLYIAPLIFGLAPLINTLISIVWHPKPDQPFNAGLELPGWKLWVGIVLIGAGAALVLFSKEEAEAHKGPPAKGSAAVRAAPQPPDVQGAQR